MNRSHIWKVHTAGLLKEILSNNETGFLRVPVQIFADILFDVGERASELNDPKLNALMCRLAIYDIADPNSKEYNPELVDKVFAEAGYNPLGVSLVEIPKKKS